MCPAPAEEDGLDVKLDDDDDWEDEEGTEWEEWTEGSEDNSTEEEKENARRSADGRTAD